MKGLTDVPGILVGHATDEAALTGVTAVLCPGGAVAGFCARGSAVGEREILAATPGHVVERVHGLCLAGGSAFGLQAAGGVVRFLEERGIGYPTPWGRVPIVPAAVVFDLNIGSPSVRPGPDAGYAACTAASPEELRQGTVGAGTGATVGKWGGGKGRMRGGLGIGSVHVQGVTVAALAVVNAVGDVLDESGRVLAGARRAGGGWASDADPLRTILRPEPLRQTNTTLTAVLIGARMAKVDAARVARRAHNGYARAVRPVHTSFDGDAVFVLAAGSVEIPVDLAAEAAAEVTAEAIRNAVRHADSAGDAPALRDLVP